MALTELTAWADGCWGEPRAAHCNAYKNQDTRVNMINGDLDAHVIDGYEMRF